MKEQTPGAETGERLHAVFGPSQDLSKSGSSLVQEALADIQQSMGTVPQPLEYLTEESLPGLWQETKALQFGAAAVLEPKYRDFISLGVAAQVPCRYTIYFELKSAQANGATAQEQTEAVLMAATTRHWSTVLNGSQIPLESFRKEVEQIVSHMKGRMGEAPPPRESFLVRFTSAAEAYKDIEQTMGIVPQFLMAFPEGALPGAWSELKGIQVNPHTAIPPKYKALSGLAVSAQIPCSYCLAFFHEIATLHGATADEMQEALALAALTRHWSTVFNGLQMGEERFQRETDQVMQHQHGGRTTHHA
jgi:AhpD family alkylhydroperoxidase